ncbi:MAG: hypothetical protein OXO49_07405 [Gammaproteobacteria bacterium]|nr:hypothetical protein [Gammaproteobacteria bacterium]MDE0251701.1 hypothetical protein [Gammaproteobacteria bacterium]MDE0403289.1 hypothetical protein [Gammaproteobacteria bacterium]
MKTSFKLKKKHIEAWRYLSELSEHQLADLLFIVGRYRAKKNILLKMLNKMLKLLGSVLCISVVVSGCSSNDHENASIEEEKCIQLSKLSNRELGELVAAALIKKFEDEDEDEDETSPELP